MSMPYGSFGDHLHIDIPWSMNSVDNSRNPSWLSVLCRSAVQGIARCSYLTFENLVNNSLSFVEPIVNLYLLGLGNVSSRWNDDIDLGSLICRLFETSLGEYPEGNDVQRYCNRNC